MNGLDSLVSAIVKTIQGKNLGAYARKASHDVPEVVLRAVVYDALETLGDISEADRAEVGTKNSPEYWIDPSTTIAKLVSVDWTICETGDIFPDDECIHGEDCTLPPDYKDADSTTGEL